MLKVDILFQQSTNRNSTTDADVRVGGWSEGWYIDKEIAAAQASVQRLLYARASMLTVACSIIGQRYRVVGGGSSTSGNNLRGSLTLQADIPQMSLFCTIGSSAAPNTRRFALRGIADARVVEGEFSPSQAMTAGLNWMAETLDKEGFRFKARDLTQPKGAVLTVDATGLVTMKDAISVAPGDFVRLLKMRDDTNKLVSGRYRVTAAPTTFTFSIAGYTGAAASGGFARKDVIIYPACSQGTFAVSRVTTHKVGNAFFRYRGRASKRR